MSRRDNEFEDELEPFIAEQMKNPAFKAAYEAEAARERVAEVLYLHDHRNPLVAPARWDKAMTLSRRQYLMRADALLAAGVFRDEVADLAKAWHEGHRTGWEHHQAGDYGNDYWDDSTPNPYSEAKPEG